MILLVLWPPLDPAVLWRPPVPAVRVFHVWPWRQTDFRKGVVLQRAAPWLPTRLSDCHLRKRR